MLRKLYSNSGLILVAILAAGVWTSNIQDYLSARNAPKPTLEELLERAANNPQALTQEDRIRIWKYEQAQASPTPRKSAEEIPGIPTPTPSAIGVLEFDRQPRRLSPTAICADGNYSYSINRRGACSRHGGVAQWLSR
jgi:hypothetical protein